MLHDFWFKNFHLTSPSQGCFRQLLAVALSSGLYSNIGSKKSVNALASVTLQLYLSMRTENRFHVFSLVMWRRSPGGGRKPKSYFPCKKLSWNSLKLAVTCKVFESVFASYYQVGWDASQKFDNMSQMILVPWIRSVARMWVEKVVAGSQFKC